MKFYYISLSQILKEEIRTYENEEIKGTQENLGGKNDEKEKRKERNNTNCANYYYCSLTNFSSE